MLWSPFRFQWFRLTALRRKEKTLRHISTVFLVLYIIFGCLVVSGCTSNSSKGLSITNLTYKATDELMEKYPKGVTQLQANVGFFASCLQIKTQLGTSNVACTTNETTVLLSNNNYFDQSVYGNVDLFNFFIGTGKRLRTQCMDPYTLIVAVVLSFACIVCFAFTSPVTAPLMYKYAAGFAYISFVLSLVSSVWLETNITTANELMNRMADNYYTLEADRGYADRGLMWAGVVLQFVASLNIGILGIVGNFIDDMEEDLGIDEKQ